MSSLLTRHIPPRAAVAVLALAVLASLLAGREKPNLAAVAHASDTVRAPAPQAAPDLDPAHLKRPALQAGQAATDPFAAPRPAAPPAEMQKPAAPTVPPLPFRYVGRAIEEGRIAVFLEKGNENYSVAQGERAGRDYKVERITDASITFTYLPLGTPQILPLPVAN